MRSTLLALAAIALLAACSNTQSLEELRVSTPHTDPYQTALAGGYQKMAEQDLAKYNYEESERWADKGLSANLGRDIAPEEVSAWKIPVAAQPQFDAARTKLIATVASTKTTQPYQSAAAMVNFDRWLQTASHEGATADQVKAAQEAFDNSLATISVAQAPELGTVAPVSEPSAQQAAPATPAAPAHEMLIPLAKDKQTVVTTIYFPFDSSALGTTAIKSLDVVIGDLKAATDHAKGITINGHTDRAGSDAYNLSLSERRAGTVAKAIHSKGVPTEKLHTFGFGETDPAVPTEDGVREPKNRRVEIFLE